MSLTANHKVDSGEVKYLINLRFITLHIMQKRLHKDTAILSNRFQEHVKYICSAGSSLRLNLLLNLHLHYFHNS